MKPSARLTLRCLAVSLLFGLGACFSTPPEAPEPEAEQPAEIVPAPFATRPPAGATQGSSTPAPPAHGELEQKEDFAPPSHVEKDDTGTSGPSGPVALPGGFAPASRMNEATQAATVKVGLLLPTTGPSAPLGQSLLDAAVMAIYDKYGPMAPREITAKVQLIPKDTGDTVEGAEKAAQDAIQDGATLLLGPVFGKQVSAVASIARSKAIPIITFSNNSTVVGENIYLFGFLPEQQVTRIVQYALSRKVANLAALVPSNPYGAAIVKQISSVVRKAGGHAHPIEYYQEDLSSLDTNIGRLARFLEEQGSTSTTQALFIGEGGQKLKSITDRLAANGITGKNIQLLGTGLWDDNDVLKWPNMYGSWFASSPPEKYHAFEQHFIQTYGYKPERLASLSYDAVALAETIALSTHGTGFPKTALLDPVGFNGPANGIFRFHDDGTIERGLSVLMVTPTGFRTIDPTPSIFNQ